MNSPANATARLRRGVSVVRCGPGIPTFLSTGLTGLTNAAMALGLQVIGGTAVLGAWVVATAPLTVALAVQRSVLSQTVLRGAAYATVRGTVVSLVTVGGVAVALVPVLVHAFDLPTEMLLIAAGTPLVLWQDAYRLRQFGSRRPWTSAGSDAIWFVVLMGSAGTAWGIGHQPTLWQAVAVYVVGAALACLFALVLRPIGSRDFSSDVRVRHLLIESGAIVGLGQIAQIVVAAVTTVTAAGELRLAVTVVLPVAFATNFAQMWLVPRLTVSTRSGLRRVRLAVGLACTALAAACLTVVAAAPFGLGGVLRIDDGAHFLGTAALVALGQVLAAGNMIWLVRARAHLPAAGWLTARLAGAVSDPVLCVPAGLLFGSVGLALGPVANNVVTLLVLRKIDRMPTTRSA